VKTCTQCGKPAIVQYDEGMYLCVDCNLKVQQAMHLIYSRLVDQTNFTNAMIEMSVGIPGLSPRIPRPRSPFEGDKLTLNNINVDRSTIGSINTGNIGRLDIAMTQIRNRGESGPVEALRELTEAVLKTQEIAEATKDELVEQISFLAQQIALPKEQRSLTIAKTVFKSLTTSISTAAGLMTLWPKVEPVLRSALGI
jgi:hypothetical protein